MTDTIVYGQSELEKAIASGVDHITLCAGVFNIPKAYDVRFDRIGPVKVTVQCGRHAAEAANMKFEGIYPQYKPEYGTDTRETMTALSAISSGSGIYGSGSFASGSGIYGSASFAFGSGYYGPMYGSGVGSFTGSFRQSGSCAAPDSLKEEIRVYGYGIDLI